MVPPYYWMGLDPTDHNIAVETKEARPIKTLLHNDTDDQECG